MATMLRFTNQDTAIHSETQRFEASLAPGSRVQARFSNGSYTLIGDAEVVRINRASIRVKLIRAASNKGVSFPAGTEFTLPRLVPGTNWGLYNGVFAPERSAPVAF